MIVRSLILALAIALPAHAADYTVDPAKSRLGFRATQQGAAFDGEFKKFDAKIAFDAANLAASKVRVEIDVTSVTTKAADRDKELPKSDWFATDKFPKAVFETTRIEARGDNKFAAVATLTIRDQTAPLVLPFTLDEKDGVAHVVGSVAIDRTTFGVGQGAWATTDIIGKPVTVTVDLVAKKQ
ncbi:YceI family protein [Roseiterribacter gracilis]|uniref:Polyisoprenoid-binding protein n=1 Tax=Roseiterribacter gracilis TaxID=2812848 RepID=A0A8S8XI26_9PROT|nr:polyisoprenoid-binding protein [Rhodospirillales bacterium TMPK1]